jgi:hypothetical protein
MSDIVEEIVKEVEHEFTPKPGGMVDTFRKDRARREEAQREKENVDEKVEEQSYKAVKTTQLSPDVTSINVVNIPAGGNAMILPNSPYRYRAIVTASVTISLSKDQGQALGGIGFPIPANTPFPVFSRAQLYAFTTGAAIVSVYAEIYSPEA